MAAGRGLGSLTLEEYEPQLWSCLSCYCGLCVEGCPCYRATAREVLAARGLAQVALAVLRGELPVEELPDELVYACTGCRWCEWLCSMNTPRFIVEHGDRRTRVSGATMAELLRALKVESGRVPKQVRDALNGLVRHGNPYGRPRALKDRWVEELGLKLSGQETLLYVGSTVPFEERAKGMAEALVELLRLAGLEFGMLGGSELDSGAFARALGEEGLFEELVEHNKRLLAQARVRQVICLSPHDYDAFLNFYGLEGVEFKHYTQVLHELLEAGRLRPGRLAARVVYHDPCYLGRRHGIYDEPRAVLKAIPGLELVEPRGWTRERSFCCGGGGAGLFYEVPGLDLHLHRIDQLAETGADYVAVACPICRQMLEDAAKSRDYGLEVRDVAELLLQAVQGGRAAG